jgi:hypothetical protein
MVTKTVIPAPGLPDFLLDYGSLMSHFESETGSLTNVAKGARFVEFAQKLIPQTEEGERFHEPQKNPKQSYDKGVDLIAEAKEGSTRLYIQAKVQHCRGGWV